MTSFYAKSDSVTSLISNFTQDVTYANFSGDREFKLTYVMQQIESSLPKSNLNAKAEKLGFVIIFKY